LQYPHFMSLVAGLPSSQDLHFSSEFRSTVSQRNIKWEFHYTGLTVLPYEDFIGFVKIWQQICIILLFDSRVLVLSRNLKGQKVMVGASHQQLFRLWEESTKNKGSPSRELVRSRSWPRKVHPLYFTQFNHHHHLLIPLYVCVIAHDFYSLFLIITGSLLTNTFIVLPYAIM